MMNLSDKAKQILAAVAPVLGTAIGGPFGTLAGAAVATALGTPPGDDKAAEAAITGGSMEALQKLREGDHAFEARMAELGIQREQLVYQDIANARAREIAVRDTTPRNLAYLVIGFTGACIVATLAGFTKVDTALAGTLIGYLVAEARSALAYYFGSSSGSKDKDDALSTIAKMP